jgi:RimJ/RimL family protein N-acetyltransferase
MQKLGMTHEGTFRQHIRQPAGFVDDIHYGLLRTEWLSRRSPNRSSSGLSGTEESR